MHTHTNQVHLGSVSSKLAQIPSVPHLSTLICTVAGKFMLLYEVSIVRGAPNTKKANTIGSSNYPALVVPGSVQNHLPDHYHNHYLLQTPNRRWYGLLVVGSGQKVLNWPLVVSVDWHQQEASRNQTGGGYIRTSAPTPKNFSRMTSLSVRTSKEAAERSL